MISKTLEEIEAKYLDVDPQELALKIEALGAKKRYKKLFRRYVFDFPGLTLNAQSAWLRIRDEGGQITMTFKQRQRPGKAGKDAGMREIEVTVSDFDKSAQILKAIGMEQKFYEENWRTLYKLKSLELCIDEWPMIPPYLEIEGSNWQKVDAAARQLGFDPKNKMVCATMQVYEHYGINEMDYDIITFEQQRRAHRSTS